MRNTEKLVSIFLLVMVGLWGCSYSTGNSNNSKKNQSIEAQNAKLNEEVRQLTSRKESLLSQLRANEEKLAQIQKENDQLSAVKENLIRERDETIALVKTRTQERDQMKSHSEQFRKSLKDLLAQSETTLPKFAPSNPSDEAPKQSASITGGGTWFFKGE